MSRNIFVSKKNKTKQDKTKRRIQIITQSGRAELGMYAEDERGRVATRCMDAAFIHNLRGQSGWVGRCGREGGAAALVCGGGGGGGLEGRGGVCPDVAAVVGRRKNSGKM